ncbi:hypothetical protein A6F57_19755 [Alteromonas stellipolaris]|uniref:hypothetical protein n=1 Tax=Alteromonas stellipolaris TaxID=233316 RepID=UPI0007B451AB|nr:hypothetical protein [Alteromonas stellipolaris]ANB27216.1 hypothetical protein A6F57_19755 [Alteromonas stellipolaris]
MNWSNVGEFLKGNTTGVTSLVGSLLTGNVLGAVSAGASMVATATGTTDPEQALLELQGTPETVLKLKKIALQREAEVNRHVESVMSLQFKDAQSSHSETQKTIRNGDNAEGGVKYVRPSHATASLLAGIYYGLFTDSPDIMILGAFLTLPFAYAGLREIGKRNVLAFNNKN